MIILSRTPRLMHRLSTTSAMALTLALTACMSDAPTPITEKMVIEKKNKGNETVEIAQANAANERTTLTYSDGLTPPLGRTLAEPFSSSVPPKLTGEKLSVNLEAIRLPAFVNTVFGDLLNVTFEIDAAVQQKEQIVTLRTAEALPPDQFFDLVRQVLGNYGISVQFQNGVYRIVDSSGVRQDIPRIVRSRAMPNVPDDQRPVFYYLPLRAINALLMQSWLTQSLPDRLQFQSLPAANGLLLLGKPEDIEAAKETVDVLDQPALAGSKSLRISPAFWSADKMANQLLEVLTAEGYSVAIGGNSSTSIKIVPVRALNTIIIFCPDDTVMQHVLNWATELDQPGQRIETKGIFYHPVFNTKAEDLAEIIEKLTGGGGVSPTLARTTAAGQALQTTPTTDQREGGGSNSVIVDKGRNALIFQGTAEEYAQFRTLVEQMDRAPLEVLIEATVAEVTLREGETLGSVLNFDDGVPRIPSRSTIESDGGLAISMIRDTGQFTASLQALADKSRVNILSSPRVVASSGKSAAISIGTQVPIITTQQTDPSGQVGGNSSLLQDIQYRNTGVILNIEPTINSNRRVELAISQEVSEAQINNVSNVQSPLILTRSIQTNLSLNDAETVLLGGLISENFSNSENGIPFLKDIPGIGNLFKTTTKGRNRTELIILLTPYIIESAETARALRDAFRDQLTGLKPVVTPTMPPPPPPAPPQADEILPQPQ